MRRLFQRQLAKATKEPGKVDLELQPPMRPTVIASGRIARSR